MKIRPFILFMGLVCASIQPVFAKVSNSKAPNVLVSIKPIFHLTQAIMKGAGEPVLLIDGTADPHHFSMAPSHARKIQKADLIIWVGPTLEHFMVKSLLSQNKDVVTLIATDGLTLLHRDTAKGRGCMLLDACEHNSTIKKKLSKLSDLFDADVAALDPHIWLNIKNVKLMVREIAYHLSAQDLLNAKIFQENSKKIIEKLTALEKELAIKAEPLAHFYFIAFHDGYGYLEHAYKMENSAAELVTNGSAPGLKSFSKMKGIIKKRDVKCILVDPQHASKLEQKIAKDFKMTLVETDPLGLEIKGDGEHYFAMMRALIDQLVDCKEGNAPPPRKEKLRKIEAHNHPHNHKNTHDHPHDSKIPHTHNLLEQQK